MSHLIDITGQRFGRLIVLKKIPHLKNNTNTRWLCQCDCGNITEVAGCHLKAAKIIACGCAQLEAVAQVGRDGATHGMSRTPLYNTWTGMKERCYKSLSASYKYYGQRGITVCEEWLNSSEVFINWALNNGYKEGLSIERKDSNGNYCPENCTWATTYEQGLNKRDTIKVEIDGQMVSLKALYDVSNSPVAYDTVRWRLEVLKWSLEDSLKKIPKSGKNAKKYKNEETYKTNVEEIQLANN